MWEMIGWTRLMIIKNWNFLQHKNAKLCNYMKNNDVEEMSIYK